MDPEYGRIVLWCLAVQVDLGVLAKHSFCIGLPQDHIIYLAFIKLSLKVGNQRLCHRKAHVLANFTSLQDCSYPLYYKYALEV